jgi:hypothetical protein
MGVDLLLWVAHYSAGSINNTDLAQIVVDLNTKLQFNSLEVLLPIGQKCRLREFKLTSNEYDLTWRGCNEYNMVEKDILLNLHVNYSF